MALRAKTCSMCGEIKTLEHFYTKGAVCKVCAQKRAKIYNDAKRLGIEPVGVHVPKPVKDPNFRKCLHCGETKSVAEFPDHKNRCTLCKKEYAAQYNEEHREELAVKGKEYRDANPEVIKARRDKYYSENKEQVLARNAKYKAENLEKVLAKHAIWRANNRARCRAYYKKHYENNKNKILVKNAKWFAENPEQSKMMAKLWARNNPEKRARAKQNRRAREARLEGYCTDADINELFKSQQGLCTYCREPLTKYHVDHIIPICREGSSGWPSNLQLLCPFCNMSKNDKNHEEYLEYLAERGPLKKVTND